MTRNRRDWLIGIVEKRYRHPGAGRYAKFADHLGMTFINTPVRFRFFSRHRLAVIENIIFRRWSRSQSEPWHPNAFGVMVQEVWALQMMRRSPGSVFHAVKGETDMHNLPRWSRRTDARLVITFHDALDMFGSKGIDREFLANVDGIAALCESQRGYFTQLMDPRRVRVLHHGVDTNFFHPPGVRRPPAQPTVISVGSYCRDHKVFLPAMERVWQVRPETKFLIVGTGTRPEDLPYKVKDARVEYLDGISDEQLRALYHESTAAAISLWAATANNAVLEAMASGLPVIATDVGGIREYLGNEAGVVTAIHDVQAFADGILAVLEQPNKAVAMGEAGRKRAVELFDYAVIAQRTREFYDDIRSWPQASQN